ncbi:pilus assembly protein TadG-related protein [Streptomyces sp. NPDC005263]|uniref:pilus assembly protein TadG-related protein n=1 Tax=Streptomyces sp. NPDC005263 TaxID=3364711 RepID=UPI0036BB4515
MTWPSTGSDTGQAFPIYIMVVAGLLFLAFAYLAVGQAAANRNGAQTAADAAALAGAQDIRDQLAGMWVKDLLDPAKWPDIFDGDVQGVMDPCWRAQELAAQNDAGNVQCDWPEPMSYGVTLRTNKYVGDSIVPGTEDKRSTASATAVIKRLCEFELPGEDAGDGVLPQLKCGDQTWDPDPDDLTTLPEPEDLFDVHLAD